MDKKTYTELVYDFSDCNHVAETDKKHLLNYCKRIMDWTNSNPCFCKHMNCWDKSCRIKRIYPSDKKIILRNSDQGKREDFGIFIEDPDNLCIYRIYYEFAHYIGRSDTITISKFY